MSNHFNSMSIKTVAVFTPYPWEHALCSFRFVEPFTQSGHCLLKGYENGAVYLDSITQADLVLFQRDFPRFTGIYEQVVLKARSEGKPIIFDIDDLLLELPEDHPDRLTHFYTPALFPMIKAIGEADFVTTSTELLKNYLLNINPNVGVLSNYLSDGLWKYQAPKRSSNPGPISIVYMGTNSHAPDVEAISPVLEKIASDFGDRVLFRFYESQPPVSMRNFSNVQWIPVNLNNYADFALFFQKQESDIYIAPLKNTFFNNCKSNVKYLEYSIHSVPGIYSCINPYENVIIQGKNGFLAADLDDWERYLIQLIEDPELRFRIGSEAGLTVAKNWLLSQHAGKWAELFNKIVDDREVYSERTLFMARLSYQAAAMVKEWQDSFVDPSHPDEELNKRLFQEEQDKEIINKKLMEITAELTELKQRVSETEKSRTWRFVHFAWSIFGKIRNLFKFLAKTSKAFQ